MYAQPQSLEQALELLQQRQWSILAGGTDYYPSLRDQAPTGAVIDITSIATLRGIVTDPDSGHIRIGALATWSALVAANLPGAFDGLKAAAIEVGSVQIQNRATLAGNLCNASPAADGVPPLLCLDAEVELASAAGVRQVPLGDFVQGNRRTLRKPDELVTAIIIPAGACTGTSAFIKLGSRRYLVISIAMAAANIELDGDGCISRAALAVGSCSEVATRLPAVERAIIGLSTNSDHLEQQLVDASAAGADLLQPIDDIRATSTYRKHAAQELIGRVLHRAAVSQASAS
jgi:CO/xanthine dehydrogenase FAD-binding subunit